MKHTMIAAGVLAALCSCAHAQTGVTVYGSFDGGLRHESNIDAAGNGVTTVSSNGTFRPNRLGFKGTEDLGNDLKVNWVLEAGFNSGTGELNNSNGVLFQREAHVGVSGKYGALDVGRNYTAAYKAVQAFDPFKFRYPSITYVLSSTNGIRKDNDVQYTGRFGNWTARVEYALGEQPGSGDNGTTKGVSLVYSGQGLKAGASYSIAEQNAGTTASPNYRDYNHYAIGASYDFGPVTAAVGHVKQAQETTTRDNTSQWDWFGASWQVSERFDITAAWYRNKAYNTRASAAAAVGASEKNLYMFGITYELSRRTTLYAEVDRTRLEGGFATGGTTKLNQTRQRGMAAGIMHMF